MYLDWMTLVLLCLAGALAWFWHASLAAREVANAAAIEACERLSLQFLDGTVAFARLRLARGSSGKLVLRRTYVFDYTANSIERRQGFIVVSERRVETVGYEQEERSESRHRAVRPATASQVVQLHERRRAERTQEDAPSPEPSRKPEGKDSGN